jgi:hypothetical protein
MVKRMEWNGLGKECVRYGRSDQADRRPRMERNRILKNRGRQAVSSHIRDVLHIIPVEHASRLENLRAKVFLECLRLRDDKPKAQNLQV